jgi:hypothetical protein
LSFPAPVTSAAMREVVSSDVRFPAILDKDPPDGSAMSRITLSEIHEQAWFPRTLRDGVLDGLQSVFRFGKVYEPIASRLAVAVKAAGARRLIDLCSGAGGPWVSLQRTLAQQSSDRLEVCLTDKYPNLAAFQSAREASGGAIDYSVESVDATTIPQGLDGFRVLFTSFHHFAPDQAAAILQSAVNNRQGIAIFEAARRRPLSILLTFLVPLGAFLTVAFIRPFHLSRLFWTYLIPVIPFVLWFDGILSCLRAYSPTELSQLVSRLDANDYKWEIGEVTGALAPVTYMLGYPEQQQTNPAVVDGLQFAASAI